MPSIILTLFLSLLLIFASSQLWQLRNNIKRAKASGLPYIVAPFGFLQPTWLILEPLLLPLLKKCPTNWTKTWLPLSTMLEMWRAGHLPFAQAGADNLLIVTARDNFFFTADAEVIDEILSTSRRNDFPKATEPMEVINIYGPTLNASEGSDARLMRKIAAPIMNEELHKKVWSYTLEQTDKMMVKACDGNISRNGFFSDLSSACNELTLSVMSYVCYDKKLEENSTVPPGHQLSYRNAIAGVMHHSFDLILIPRLLLKILPTETCRSAYTAFSEWLKYMTIMRDEELKRQDDGVFGSNSNLLSALVANEAKLPTANGHQLPPTGSRYLTSEEVMGNIYFFLLAGHETTANSLSISLILLALHQDIQKKVYQDLQHIFGSRLSSPKSWSFESDMPKLDNGMMGALLHETLRIWMAGPTTARRTFSPQPITVDGTTYVVPKDVFVYPNFPASQRNPKYWRNRNEQDSTKSTTKASTKPSFADDDTLTDIFEAWDPMRWLEDPPRSTETAQKDGGLFGRLKNPVPGSWTPFSRGPRSCLGSRFAQVEYCAFISRVLSEFRVELNHEAFSNFHQAKEAALKSVTTDVTITLAYKPGRKALLKFVPRRDEAM